MSAAQLTLTTLAIVANAGIAVADLAKAPFVLANSAEVRVPRSWIAPLALTKLAGAAGLALGLAGFGPIGLAAAAGLVLFFVGAVGVHLYTRVLHNLAFPLGYLALAVGALVTAAGR
ncbi:DoxX family protein [Kitasatospora sp. NPDC058965]|uniref:DoxX family protein n=1 Tax=Kitasatospora sp. NPDC058965 TaxID=3346682 RepID=UPI0036CFAA8B